MISRENEHRYRDLLNFIKYGVQENDCSGTITYSNRAHHRILGYSDGQLLGQKIWDNLHPSLDKKSLKAYLARLVYTRPAPTPYITQNIKKNGISVNLQFDWDYAYNEKSELTGFVSVSTDVTESSDLEENLYNRNREYASLLNICKSLSETLDLQKVFQISVDSVTDLIGLDTAAVYLLVDDVLQICATTPALPPDFPEEMRYAPLADHPHAQRAIKYREPLYIFDQNLLSLPGGDFLTMFGVKTFLELLITSRVRSRRAFSQALCQQPSQVFYPPWAYRGLPPCYY